MRTRKSGIILGILSMTLLTACCSTRQEPWGEEGMEGERYVYVTNGKVQIGVDMAHGGAIFHFSTKDEKTNRLNHCDEGRFIQQSYYGSDGHTYYWTDNRWSWNPIQGGGSDGTPSKVLLSEVTSSSIHIISMPKQWGRTVKDGPCDLAQDCLMEETITLENGHAILDFTFTYTGDKDLGTASQELPAFFCDRDLGRYVRYDGERPWTDDELTVVTPKVLDGISNPNPASKESEHWRAYVNQDGYGIGLYTPGTDTSVYYTAGEGPGGANSYSCSYFAPIRSLRITPGFHFNYKAYLTIGTIQEIRDTFKAIHQSALE